MFAGRYLWWMLIGIAGFLFFAVYFDYVAWAVVEVSSCGKSAVSCGPLAQFLAGTIKPAGFWLSGGILFLSMLARIHYLRINYLWAVAVAVWFLAAAPFPLLFADIWSGQLRWDGIFTALPIPLLFLAAFAGYLMLPFDEGDEPVFGRWRTLRRAVWLAACQSVLLTLATEPGLPIFLSTRLGLAHFAFLVAHLQPHATGLLLLGTGSLVPAYLALAIFAGSLLAGLVPEERVEAAVRRFHRLMQAGSPPRRSGRA